METSNPYQALHTLWIDGFVLADLKGLAQEMMTQGWIAFQKLQSLKSQVNEATTVSAVQAVVW